MGFDPTTYALSKSAAESGAMQAMAPQYQTVETRTNVLATQNDNLLDLIRNLSGVIMQLNLPVYGNAYGDGVIYVRDAAAGKISYIAVGSALAGQTLYVQVSNASGMTDAQAEVDDNGYATVDLSTVSGENIFYVTTQDYAFPPTGDGEHGELNGVYVNARTNENGLAVYDFIRPTNGVYAVLRYRMDLDKYLRIANESSSEQILAASGKGVRYDAVQNPLSLEYENDFFYMKLDGAPYGTQDKPAYVITGYPNPDCQVYYVRRFYDLTE